MPIKPLALPMMDAGCRQMTDPPDGEEQDQQEPFQPGALCQHGALDVPATTFEILEGRLDAHAASILAHPLAASTQVRERKPGVLIARLPHGAEKGVQAVLVPDEGWTEPRLAHLAHQVAHRHPPARTLATGGPAGM